MEITGLSDFPSISIVIPFRNELYHLRSLLLSLEKLNYPSDKYEIIFVDDHSTDGGSDLINTDENQYLIYSDGQGKKAALETGIAFANMDIIATTDADCILPPDWLQAIATAYSIHDYALTTGPVTLTGTSAFANMQVLENAGMMVMTQVGYATDTFHLANGANFSFKKEAYTEVGGYSDNKDRASGDDVLLAQLIADRYKVGFLKTESAIVTTAAVDTVKDFWQQRLRWATKSDIYTESSLFFLPGFIAAYYGLLLMSLLFFPDPLFWLALKLIGVKVFMDFILFIAYRKFFKYSWNKLVYLIPASLFHLIYVPIIGVWSLFIKDYRWKGRKVR